MEIFVSVLALRNRRELMILQRIRILHYKNIEEADLSFSPKINCFIGNNGEGKTNLLDAIYYLSFCKSHTNLPDGQNIRHGVDFFMIEGDYERTDSTTNIYCGVKRRQKKIFKCDKKEYEKLADHIGLIPLVLVSPADEELILGGSEERRKFIDGFIAQYDNVYLNELLSYKNLLMQRNSMIRNEVKDDLLYESIEERMSMHGAYVHERREMFINDFHPYFMEFHKSVSLEKESVELRYVSQLQNGSSFAELLKKNREKDFIVGYTTVGVHRDDLEMTMAGAPIRKFGSQGQNKTYLIALKLAQFDFLHRLKNEKPILLFDDIFDKLDATRVDRIVRMMTDNHFGQVFISDTNREHLSSILKNSSCEYHLYRVENGVVELKDQSNL